VRRSELRKSLNDERKEKKSKKVFPELVSSWSLGSRFAKLGLCRDESETPPSWSEQQSIQLEIQARNTCA